MPGAAEARGALETAVTRIDTRILWRTAAALLAGCAGLALLTAIGVALDLSHPATGALVYMIVVVLVSMTGNIAAGIGLAIFAAFSLNYFFTEPRFSLQIKTVEDMVAMTAFALTAVTISVLVTRARKQGEAIAVRDRLQVIIDTIPAMVWSISPDGSSDFLNKRFRDYTGLSLEDIRDWARMDTLHRPWMNALHPDDRSMDDWSAALASGEPFEKEARLRQFDGEYRRFLLRFVPLRDEWGRIVEWYAKSTDIEDLRRAEEELRRREARLRDAQLELAHANRVTTTGQLAASIAHEVSQPIAAALTNANTARRWLGAEPPDLDEVRQALDRIIRDGERAREVIGRIRALVRKAPPLTDQLDIQRDNARSHRVFAQRTGQKRNLAADPAGRRPAACSGRSNPAATGDAKPDSQRGRSDERTARDGARAAYQNRARWIGRCARRRRGFRPRLAAGDPGSALRAILHDQARRYGHGIIDLPFDHRGPWRARVGRGKDTPGCHLSVQAPSAT